MDTTFFTTYPTPLGAVLLTATEDALTGLWFAEHHLYQPTADEQALMVENPNLSIFQPATKWVKAYFSGEKPTLDFALKTSGTVFQEAVWALLREIPYGETVTYGDLASELHIQQSRIRPPAAQAVGGAVGHNPISLIVPCHRVVGANGKLTGYGGGLDRKAALLDLEQRD